MENVFRAVLVLQVVLLVENLLDIIKKDPSQYSSWKVRSLRIGVLGCMLLCLFIGNEVLPSILGLVIITIHLIMIEVQKTIRTEVHRSVYTFRYWILISSLFFFLTVILFRVLGKEWQTKVEKQVEEHLASSESMAEKLPNSIRKDMDRVIQMSEWVINHNYGGYNVFNDGYICVEKDTTQRIFRVRFIPNSTNTVSRIYNVEVDLTVVPHRVYGNFYNEEEVP